ncbi:MAG: 8-amino-7-oxononanoate synthase [Planctomycetota bacterium]
MSEAGWQDFERSLDTLRNQSRFRQLQPFRTEGLELVDRAGNRFLNFGGNDYLGLAAGRSSVPPPSAAAVASALVCGWTDQHEALARQIARWEGTESAVVFPSGYAACSGTIAALGREGDLILSDALNHASLIDGCRLSRAERVVFPHRDVESVAEVLKSRRGQFARVWIVTESVFSMDGHLAPLVELLDVAERYGATLVVDEAHASGVFGGTGSGLCEELGLKERVGIRIGTLSKAVAARGGFVAAPRIVADFLVNHCRSLIFSTSLSQHEVRVALESLERICGDSEARMRVRSMARLVRERLGIAAQGLEVDVPIVPFLCGLDARALEAAGALREAGLFVPAIRPPTVPEGQARLRASLSAGHEEGMILRLVEALLSLR